MLAVLPCPGVYLSALSVDLLNPLLERRASSSASRSGAGLGCMGKHETLA